MIEFKNIHLQYNGKEILKGLSFEVKSGEKVAVIGKSGSGKSSLFQMALGFVIPVHGEIFFNGFKVDEKSCWNIRKKVACIDQDVSIGIGDIRSLFDFISKIKVNSHLDFSKKKIDKLLDFFELETGTFDKNIEELSGGERQRLAIIISVLLERKIFFLDEITSALDKNLKKKVADFFIEKKEWTTLIISHDPVWVENPAVKVFDLEEGKWNS
ncbi:MAG: ABC transporter ATP-binding protein [Alphaproteobacteria bacterium]